MACILDDVTNRPVAGIINFNPYHIYTDPGSYHYMYRIAIHEISHILAFSSVLYQYFIDPTTNQRRAYSTTV
jgi:hypothetical protein